MIAWQAFANMLRAAARDPVWAVSTVILSPVRIGKHLFFVLITSVCVFSVLALAVDVLLGVLGLRNKAAYACGFVLALGVTLVFLVRRLTAPMIEHFGQKTAHTHGSARLANAGEIRRWLRSAPVATSLLVGRDCKTGALLRYDGTAHLLTMAATRSGKGIGTLIPNLLTARRSIICIDPKGENAKLTYRARARFGAVHVLDPFGITGLPASAFNPLARLDPESLDAAEEAGAIADALVYDPPHEAGEAHWNEEAKALISGLCLYTALEARGGDANLSMLREYLTMRVSAFQSFLARLSGIHDARGLIARAANRHLAKSEREAASVLSTAQRHTHFLDSPRIQQVLARSDFAFADLKTGIATVFLVLPPERLQTYARWLRLLLTQSLEDMARAKVASPVLYLLDEFAALGRLSAIERAMGLMAGYGVQLWPILQDLHQLRAAYGAHAGTFFANAGVLQVFGVNDHDSARLVSDLLGQETVVFQTTSRALDSNQSGLTFSEHHTGRPLFTPDEVRRLPSAQQLLFLSGARPILANKLCYFTDREFEGLFDTR